MNKLLQAAISAKQEGYQYLTSVVKQVYNTTYHNVVRVDEIIENGGKWPAAPHHNFGWSGPVGQREVPEKSLNKSVAIARYCK